MSCAACGRGLHRECRKGCKKCHSDETPVEVVIDDSEPKERKKNNLKDPSSTGRKRAARLYKIDSEAPCEWQKQRNCGGGLRPIIGCNDGKQKHLHHGPIKKTTRNELGNVHRICTNCHNHWHELNDLIYNEADYELLPHAPVPANDVDIFQNILDWKSGEMGRRFELASSRNRGGKNEHTGHESDDGFDEID